MGFPIFQCHELIFKVITLYSRSWPHLWLLLQCHDLQSNILTSDCKDMTSTQDHVVYYIYLVMSFTQSSNLLQGHDIYMQSWLLQRLWPLLQGHDIQIVFCGQRHILSLYPIYTESSILHDEFVCDLQWLEGSMLEWRR